MLSLPGSLGRTKDALVLRARLRHGRHEIVALGPGKKLCPKTEAVSLSPPLCETADQWDWDVEVDEVRPVMKPTAKPPAAPARTETSTSTIRFSNHGFFLDPGASGITKRYRMINLL
jgi:hypothetical protein